MYISRILKYSLAVLLSAILYACQQSTVYYTYHDIPTEGWAKNDTLSFLLPDTLTPGTYNLEIGIRHSGKYAYRDMWLELTQYVPSAYVASDWVAHRDTIHLYLANEKGNWEGAGTTGGYFQLITKVGMLTVYPHSVEQEVVHLTTSSDSTANLKGHNVISDKKSMLHSKKTKYTFKGKKHRVEKQDRLCLRLTQIMTDSVLYHVSDVGIRLTP